MVRVIGMVSSSLVVIKSLWILWKCVRTWPIMEELKDDFRFVEQLPYFLIRTRVSPNKAFRLVCLGDMSIIEYLGITYFPVSTKYRLIRTYLLIINGLWYIITESGLTFHIIRTYLSTNHDIFTPIIRTYAPILGWLSLYPLDLLLGDTYGLIGDKYYLTLSYICRS